MFTYTHIEGTNLSSEHMLSPFSPNDTETQATYDDIDDSKMNNNNNNKKKYMDDDDDDDSDTDDSSDSYKKYRASKKSKKQAGKTQNIFSQQLTPEPITPTETLEPSAITTLIHDGTPKKSKNKNIKYTTPLPDSPLTALSAYPQMEQTEYSQSSSNYNAESGSDMESKIKNMVAKESKRKKSVTWADDQSRTENY